MTRAVETLLMIMSDSNAWLGRRIEAADGLLSYEAPPEAAEAAKSFLASVFEDAEQDLELRLGALKLMRKAEARKITPASVAAVDEHRRELWRRAEIGFRRTELIRAGLWPAPVGWADDLQGDNYQPPQGDFRQLLQKAWWEGASRKGRYSHK